MNIEEIFKNIPQRYPFIFIDKVIHLEPAKRIKAIKNVSINEPYFSGHFPGQPVMPGVLILEALAQASIILARTTHERYQKDDSLTVFAGIDKARFKRIVCPGDQLELNVEFLKMRREVWKMSAVAKVEDDVACTAELMSAKKGKE